MRPRSGPGLARELHHDTGLRTPPQPRPDRGTWQRRHWQGSWGAAGEPAWPGSGGQRVGVGGLTILLGEPLTSRSHRLSVKVVVFNNSSLRRDKLAMLAEGYPEFQSDHDTVDFAGRAGPRLRPRRAPNRAGGRAALPAVGM